MDVYWGACMQRRRVLPTGSLHRAHVQMQCEAGLPGIHGAPWGLAETLSRDHIPHSLDLALPQKRTCGQGSFLGRCSMARGAHEWNQSIEGGQESKPSHILCCSPLTLEQHRALGKPHTLWASVSLPVQLEQVWLHRSVIRVYAQTLVTPVQGGMLPGVARGTGPTDRQICPPLAPPRV